MAGSKQEAGRKNKDKSWDFSRRKEMIYVC